jgi:hypothetical protein
MTSQAIKIYKLVFISIDLVELQLSSSQLHQWIGKNITVFLIRSVTFKHIPSLCFNVTLNWFIQCGRMMLAPEPPRLQEIAPWRVDEVPVRLTPVPHIRHYPPSHRRRSLQVQRIYGIISTDHVEQSVLVRRVAVKIATPEPRRAWLNPGPPLVPGPGERDLAYRRVQEQDDAITAG